MRTDQDQKLLHTHYKAKAVQAFEVQVGKFFMKLELEKKAQVGQADQEENGNLLRDNKSFVGV